MRSGLSACHAQAGKFGERAVTRRLVARMRRQASRPVVAQFLRFGVVGAIGFGFDTATVYASRAWLGLYGAGVLAYFVAATVTWWLNRQWTFRGGRDRSALRQWGRFLLANGAGFVLNRGLYAILVTASPFCATYPVVAVAAGCLAGMFSNFGLSRALVFR
jgi:putative flippase GtrA